MSKIIATGSLTTDKGKLTFKGVSEGASEELQISFNGTFQPTSLNINNSNAFVISYKASIKDFAGAHEFKIWVHADRIDVILDNGLIIRTIFGISLPLPHITFSGFGKGRVEQADIAPSDK